MARNCWDFSIIMYFQHLNFNNVQGTVYFGPLPSLEEIQALKSRVILIWNLCAETPKTFQMEQSIIPLSIYTPINDFNGPKDIKSFIKALDIIENTLKTNNVYIHCLMGRGRTGMAVASLALRFGFNAEDALDLASYYCNGPETEGQKNFVRELANNI